MVVVGTMPMGRSNAPMVTTTVQAGRGQSASTRAVVATYSKAKAAVIASVVATEMATVQRPRADGFTVVVPMRWDVAMMDVVNMVTVKYVLVNCVTSASPILGIRLGHS
jgi:hypothetical protein